MQRGGVGNTHHVHMLRESKEGVLSSLRYSLEEGLEENKSSMFPLSTSSTPQ